MTASPSNPAAKQLVRRLVDDVINSDRLDVLDELCTPSLTRRLRVAFSQFRSAFPDWRMEIVRLVAEPEVVVARFRCTGTQRGEWLGMEATNRAMSIDEVFFFDVEGNRLSEWWALEDTWTRVRQLAPSAPRHGPEPR